MYAHAAAPSRSWQLCSSSNCLVAATAAAMASESDGIMAGVSGLPGLTGLGVVVPGVGNVGLKCVTSCESTETVLVAVAVLVIVGIVNRMSQPDGEQHDQGGDADEEADGGDLQAGVDRVTHGDSSGVSDNGRLC